MFDVAARLRAEEFAQSMPRLLEPILVPLISTPLPQSKIRFESYTRPSGWFDGFSVWSRDT